MMHAAREHTNTADQPSEDDMAEGDLGDGTRSGGGIHQSRSSSRGDSVDLPAQAKPSKRGSDGNGGSFSWTPCSGMYTAFRKELEAERISQWRIRDSGGSKSPENRQNHFYQSGSLKHRTALRPVYIYCLFILRYNGHRTEES